MFDRIIVLTPQVGGKDGISRVADQMLEALSSDAAATASEVTCWSLGPQFADPQAAHSSPVKFRYASGSRGRFGTWGLCSAMERQNRTLVIAVHLHLAQIALPMVARGAQLAVFLHGIEAWNRLDGLRKVAVYNASTLISNSQYTMSTFLAMNPNCTRPSTRVCHLGLPSHAIPAGPQKNAGPFALMVGRMRADERYKGQDLILESWTRVRELAGPVSLVIAGDGNDRPRLEKKAADLGLGDSVKFLGQVSEEHLSGLYRDCTFFLMPSSREGFGLVFLEAMRASKACIGAVGAASEVIVDPRDANQVVHQIVRLFQTPEVRDRMGRSGAARFHSKFTDQHFGARLRSCLGVESVEDCRLSTRRVPV